MPKYEWWKAAEYVISGEPTGRTNSRPCGTCGRPIKEHKQKVMGRWVCDLVLMDTGRLVHSSRVQELIKKGQNPVFRWNEAE